MARGVQDRGRGIEDGKDHSPLLIPGIEDGKRHFPLLIPGIEDRED